MISLMKNLKPYRLYVILVVVLTMAAILLELNLPTLMANVIDIGIVNRDIPYILKTGGLMIACSIASILLTISVMFFSSRASMGFGRDLRRKLFVHVESFSLQEFERIGPSSLITRTTNDIKQVQDVLTMMMRMMTRAPLMLIGGIMMAVSRDAFMSLIFLIALPLLAGTIYAITRKSIPLFGELQRRTDKLNLLLREGLIGVRVVRAFNRVAYEKQRFQEANESFRDTGIRVGQSMALMFPVMMIIMNFTQIAIIWIGATRIDAGLMQVGNLMAFLQYASMILFSLIMLSMMLVMVPRAQVSARRINEVLEQLPLIVDPKPGSSAQANLQRGHVEFRNVTFRYAGAEKPALEGISFRAVPGQTTAIIGSTGAGKTSLVQLIPRFYEAEDGEVLVNGVDVRLQTQEELRSSIGYVPQKAVLFSGTVAENLRFGSEHADDAALLAALETAQALNFVQEKEGGLHAKIEQSGANLSGGQKQRLSIARALVRKPDIYIFDDSFSALDYATDARLRKALKREAGSAAVIIVAQRISTVVEADQIIVLNEGRMAGIGTHAELLQSNEIYQEIVASQLSPEGEEIA
ncbi:ABC transporter ATP-binding protein [Paenibacillus chartarius]|uniref:ABC transporter ATP-binding protein n=1 Tax=Paenibacillus chartarius TaxID=747481 RepID=A0ABV6DTL5_9BACL